MTTYAITRHAGAKHWLAHHARVDAYLSHLDVGVLQAGDCVIGLLPAHLVAQLCAQGVRYLHLAMEVPEALRGLELTLEQMQACNARLIEISAKEICFE